MSECLIPVSCQNRWIDTTSHDDMMGRIETVLTIPAAHTDTEHVEMDYSDRDVDDLLRSSLEVSSSLDVFMREREQASFAQETAWKAYEADMLHISASAREVENETYVLYICLPICQLILYLKVR